MQNFVRLFAAAAVCVVSAGAASALTLGTDFAPHYATTDLGSIAGVPINYGGLTLKAGSPNTLLIGGAANGSAGRLYEVGLVRDPVDGSITGFTGTPTAMGDVGEFNDGGVVYGPGGVLFTARWSINELGQTLPGGTDEYRIDSLAGFGVPTSISALNFVPTGFGGAGQGKIVTYSGGAWFDMMLTPDGGGGFDLGFTAIDLDPVAPGVQNLPGGPEGFTYVAAGNPGFSVNSMLVAEYSAGKIAAYEVDANGNPILSTRRDFITGLSGAEGAYIDPVSGDFLFSTFGGGNRVIRVDGFNAPAVPLPAGAWLLLSGLGAAAALRRRRR
jgi:hypothetical protein